MKTLLVAVLICLPVALLKGQGPRDPYQDVAPDLVRKVELAKQKQLHGDPREDAAAESLLLDVLKSKPDYYRALYNLGLIYVANNQADKAIPVLLRAKGIRDTNNNLHDDNAILNTLGWAYVNNGELNEAERYLKDAYDMKTKNDAHLNERIMNNLGYLYLQEGKTTEARKLLEESKKQFNSNRANSILKLVNDYEQRQIQSESFKQLWAGYGQQPKAGGEWSQRHFNDKSKDKKAIPQADDIVEALDKSYIRTAVPVWDDNSNDFLYGPIVGYIKPGDKLQVLQVVDKNATDAKNKSAWYWIRFKRFTKE
jgi:tetratricopeptide (TPR) repeat protein